MAASSLEMLLSGKADLWDTGKVVSGKSIHVEYKGRKLVSGQRCWWKVCTWDREDEESDWSEPVWFEMGLLDESDWKGKWISASTSGTDIDRAIPAPLFRKTINLEKSVYSARAYICGLGYQELYINGSKIGDDVLSPAFTRYDRSIMYNTYDITENLKPGENVIGVILGNGWYNCFTSFVCDYRQAPWRHHPKLLLQLKLVFDDGETLIVSSDTSWKVSGGPIVFDGLRNGEFYDARLEKPGWNKPGYDDSGWGKAGICRSPGGLLKSFQMAPIKVTGTIKPVGLKEIKPGVWVYDLGQNISGWAQLQVSGPRGTEIKLRYAEKVLPDGSIDQSNVDVFIKSGEYQTDKYILKGEGIEVWEPRFTYHGFQYVEVTGFPCTPDIDSICGRVVHTAFDTRGVFQCSDELLNTIQRCAGWSTLTNYHGIPTDCPQREKNGWTGDASLSAEQVLLNFNPVTAYKKWMMDFQDVQRPSGQLPGIVPTGGWGFNWGSGPAWDSAMILIPWYMYEYCGDTSILSDMYGNMKKYMDYMTSMADEHIVDFGLGDWCPPVGGFDKYKCPSAVTDTAYYYTDAVIVSRSAAILGKSDDASYYADLAGKIREAFRERFLDSNFGIVEGNCQTSMSCALYQGLVDEDERDKVFERLIEQVELHDCHIDCGILGAKYILQTLTALGRADLAYEMAVKRDFPGWGDWIGQGATTLWETWNGDASRNHHMFSDISSWFYKGLAGINPDPDEPGFKHIIVRPNPVKGLSWVKSYHESMYGKIVCNWSINGNLFTIHMNVPVNCHASLYLPLAYSNNVKESGINIEDVEGVRAGNNARGQTVLMLESGEYNITTGK